MNQPLGPPSVLRKKRRPAQSCHQCRQRKIKCDRSSPCRQCVKANITSCIYVRDTRISLTKAPFEGEETQFFVFDQRTCGPVPESSVNPASVEMDFPDLTVTSPSSSSGCSTGEISSNFFIPSQTASIELDEALSKAFEEDDGRGQPTSLQAPQANQRWPQSLDGLFFKSKFCGRSHWKHYGQPSHRVIDAIIQHICEPDCGRVSIIDCWQSRRAIKEQEFSVTRGSQNLLEILPPMELSTRLLQAYLRTFQTVFGIVDLSRFRLRYAAFWANPNSADDDFLLSLLLTMCIGSVFCPKEHQISRNTVLKWFYSVSARLGAVRFGGHLTVESVRIQCLYFLAHQVISAKCHSPWIWPGALSRMAMHMGLHLDPRSKPASNISPIEFQANRKLWATVLEIEAQMNLDSGTSPILDPDYYVFQPPMNVDDELLPQEGTLEERPITQLTQSSIQILLMRTMGTRLKIAHFINGTKSTRSTETALTLRSELLDSISSCKTHLESYHMSSRPPTTFQTRLFDVLVHRFLLAIHNAISRIPEVPCDKLNNTGLETALYLLSLPTHSDTEDFCRLRLRSSGLFRNVYREAALLLSTHLLDHPERDPIFFSDDWRTRSRVSVRKAIESYLMLARDRMESGDSSIKCYILVSCMLAQVYADSMGYNIESKIREALEEAVRVCYGFLHSQLQGAILGEAGVHEMICDHTSHLGSLEW